MNLSSQAINELREALRNDIGHSIDSLTEAELNEFGLLLLNIDASYLKVSARSQQ